MVSEKLHVCFVVTTVSRLGGGVAEATREQALALVRAGLQVSVVTLFDRHFEEDVKRWTGINVVPCPRIGPSILGFSPVMLSRLLKVKPEIVHVHGIWQLHCLVTLLWSMITGRPYIVSPHGMLDPWIVERSGLKKRIFSFLFHNKFLRRAARFQVLTTTEQSNVRAIVGDTANTDIIGNILTVLPRSGPPSWLRSNLVGQRIYLYLGRIHEKKGCLELCDAWDRLCAQDKTFARSSTLVIAGWNDGLEGFEARIAALAAQHGNAFFVGPVYGEEKWRTLDAASVFLLPSKSEGLPMSILEAWSCGMPVAMTDACNLPEGFAAGAGLRIETDVTGIMQGLETLSSLDDAALARMGAAGKGLMETRFSTGNIERALLHLYRKVRDESR